VASVADAPQTAVPAHESGGERGGHRDDGQAGCRQPERGNVSERDPQPEQRDRPSQHGFQAEHDAGLKRWPSRQGIEGDADDERNHHGRNRQKAHYERRDVRGHDCDQGRQQQARQKTANARQAAHPWCR
jgi:hypothetical protein